MSGGGGDPPPAGTAEGEALLASLSRAGFPGAHQHQSPLISPSSTLKGIPGGLSAKLQSDASKISIADLEEIRLLATQPNNEETIDGVARPGRNLSAMEVTHPPYQIVVIYNQSRHASNSVLADVRAVWGQAVIVVQTVEDNAVSESTETTTNSVANNRLQGVDDVILVRPGKWGDLDHFKERMGHYETQNPWFWQARRHGEVVFMAGWSALAESAETGRIVKNKLGLVWPGTDPDVSDRLEKIGMKQICKKVGAPTPPFTILSGQDFVANIADEASKKALIEKFVGQILEMNTAVPGLVKSIHGGGGKGSAQVANPRSPDQVRAAVSQVLNEMKRADGVYFEEKVNHDGDGRFYQLELELDGTTVANGGRFVWFNKRLQKVVEIGLTDQYLKDLSEAHDSGYGDDLPYFIPWKLYSQARQWAASIAAEAGNNTRATLEGLVWRDKEKKFHFAFIECNRRPQVENEALALLERDSSNNRRYTFAELMMRAKGYPGSNIFQPTRMRNVACHARWLHGDPDENGMITYKPGEVVGMQGPQFAFVRSELMPAGEISFTSDPQLGKVVMLAENWHRMCVNAERYFHAPPAGAWRGQQVRRVHAKAVRQLRVSVRPDREQRDLLRHRDPERPAGNLQQHRARHAGGPRRGRAGQRLPSGGGDRPRPVPYGKGAARGGALVRPVKPRGSPAPDHGFHQIQSRGGDVERIPRRTESAVGRPGWRLGDGCPSGHVPAGQRLRVCLRAVAFAQKRGDFRRACGLRRV
ncbi:unnamed protein product [Amoebophrya sp. A120]|nr:unnamed protein product [Amoebophrya sp. A120]|eukprot:GSA120T00025778001.1